MTIIHAEVYDVLGSRVRIGADSPVGIDALRNVLSGFGPIATEAVSNLPHYDLIGHTADAPGWLVRSGQRETGPFGQLSDAIAVLESQILTEALVPLDADFHLHGAALCLPTRSEGLLLCGRSGVGKSTLALGLMLRGFMPFGDDVILLEPETLKVRAVKRAFHVSDESWKLVAPLSAARIRPEAPVAGFFVPPQWAERPVAVRWILFPEIRPGKPPELSQLSGADIAARLLRETGSLAPTPRLALKTVARLVENAQGFHLSVGDVPASVALIERLVTGAFGNA